MNDLDELLGEAAEQTTFALTGRQLSIGQFRELLERYLPNDKEAEEARGARVVLPDDLLARLSDCIREYFGEYVEESTDRIGHAFRIGGQWPLSQESSPTTTYESSGIVSFEETSPVETFARALVRGAAVLGVDRATSLVLGCARGEPVPYKTRSVLNADGILPEPLSPIPGVRIESLPLSTDQLTQYLPPFGNQSSAQYLGRMVLTVDHVANPPLFCPNSEQTVRGRRATAAPEADADVVCQALALEINAFVEVALSWHHFGEFDAFRLSGGHHTWSTAQANFRTTSYTNFSISTDHATGVTSLTFRDPQHLQADSDRLKAALAAMAEPKSDLLPIAASRWLRSKDTSSGLTDQFIDLRIALESLYLQDSGGDQKQEMRFRLALIGAWHLGADFQERKRIRKTLRDAYDTASKAVHGGDIDHGGKKPTEDNSRIQWRKNQQLLSDAQDIVRRGLLKMLREGPPRDWGDLILGDDGGDTE